MKATAIYLDGKLIGEYGTHPNPERHAWGPVVNVRAPVPKRYLQRKYRPVTGEAFVQVGGEGFPAKVEFAIDGGLEIVRIERK